MNQTKLLIVGALAELLFCSMPSHASDDYTCEVEITAGENVLMSEDNEKAILDKKEGVSYQFKAIPKFTPDSENEWIEYLGGQTRKYTWEPEAIMKGDPSEGITSTGICTPKDETWGTEFKVKVKVFMGLIGKKKKIEETDGEIDVIAPKIEIVSATFSKNDGGNGFIIHDKFRGNSVSTPEFKKDDQIPDNDKSPIGYYAGDVPSFKVIFKALPESMKSIQVQCVEGIFESHETELSIDGGKAEGIIGASHSLGMECRGGEEKGSWRFSVLGATLSSQEEMVISKCYVLLNEGSRDKPWKSLLRVAFDRWNFDGATSHDELMDRLSLGISNSASYYTNWRPETGQTGSLYVDQNNPPCLYLSMA